MTLLDCSASSWSSFPLGWLSKPHGNWWPDYQIIAASFLLAYGRYPALRHRPRFRLSWREPQLCKQLAGTSAHEGKCYQWLVLLLVRRFCASTRHKASNTVSNKPISARNWFFHSVVHSAALLFWYVVWSFGGPQWFHLPQSTINW